MNYFILVLITILNSCIGTTIIYGSHLKSLRCMSTQTESEYCNAAENAKALDPSVELSRVLEVYKNESEETRRAFDTGDFSHLMVSQLYSTSPILISLVPSNWLANIGASKLGHLLGHWNQNSTAAALIVSAARHVQEKSYFIYQFQSILLSEEVFDIIGEEIIHWKEFESQRMLINSFLIAHLPLEYVAEKCMTNATNIETLFFLTSVPVDSTYWHSRPKSVQKIWGKIIASHQFPVPLSVWTDSHIKKYRAFTIGFHPKDLKQLNSSLIRSRTDLSTYGYTNLQIRSVFRAYRQMNALSKRDFEKLKTIVLQLTPMDLRGFPISSTNYKTLKNHVSKNMLATVKQVIEYLMIENYDLGKYHKNGTSWSGDSITMLGHYVFALPVSALSSYKTKPLPLKQILPLQSHQLTKFQAYLLTGQGNSINLTHPNIFLCKQLLQAVPTSNIVSLIYVPSEVYSHLLSESSFDELKTFALLNTYWPGTGSIEELKWILQNNHAEQIVELLPSKTIANFSNMDLDRLTESELNKITTIYSLQRGLIQSEVKEWSVNALYGENNSLIKSLLTGITCKEVNSMNAVDFQHIISEFNRLRKLNKMEFPKNLQYCVTEKLIEYLHLKSDLLPPGSDSFGVIEFLSDSDLYAFGSYILAFLSPEDIFRSDLKYKIVKHIGQLSLPEMLAATSRSNLQEIVSTYLEERMVLDHTRLFELGNLTSFIPSNQISLISPNVFKLVMESEHIDKRLCVSKNERFAWRKLILRSFGPTDSWDAYTLVTLSDFMIVLTGEDFDKIDSSAWIDAADSFASRYNDEIEWINPEPFYKVCMEVLGEIEQGGYLSSVRLLVRKYLIAAQLLLNTVVERADLLRGRSGMIQRPSSSISMSSINIPTYVHGPSDHRTTTSSTTETVTLATDQPVTLSTFSSENANLTKDHGHIESSSTRKAPVDDNLFPSIIGHNTTSTGSPVVVNSTKSSVISSTSNNKPVYSSTETVPSTTKPPIILDSTSITPNASSSFNKSLVQHLENPSERLPTFSQIPSSTAYSSTPIDITTTNPYNLQSTINDSTLITSSIRPTDSPTSSTSTTSGFEDRSETSTFHQLETTEKPLQTIALSKFASMNRNKFVRKHYSNASDSDSKLRHSRSNESVVSEDEKDVLIGNDSLLDKIYNKKVDDVFTSTEAVIESVQFTTETIATSETSRPEETHAKNHEVLNNETTTEETELPITTEKALLYVTTEEAYLGVTTIESDLCVTSEEDQIETTTIEAEGTTEEATTTEKSKKRKSKNNKNQKLNLEEEIDDSIDISEADESNPVELEQMIYHPDAELELKLKKSDLNNSEETKVMAGAGGALIAPFVPPVPPPAPIPIMIPLPKIPRKRILPLSNNSERSVLMVTVSDSEPSSPTPILDNSAYYPSNYGETWLSRRKRNALTRISCEAIHMIGPISNLGLLSSDILAWSDTEVINCAELLGSMELTVESKKQLLAVLPKDELHLYGALIEAVTVEDLQNHNFVFSHAWTLELVSNIGKYNQNNSVIDFVINMIELNNNNNYSSVELAALGPLLCKILSDSKFHASIQPSRLARASTIFSRQMPCQQSCLKALMRILTDGRAYGPPLGWSSEDVESLGILVAGLDKEEWLDLAISSKKPLYGLQPKAASCIPYEYWQVTSESIVNDLPYYTRRAVIKHHLTYLSNNMKDSFLRHDVSNIQISQVYPSSSSLLKANSLIVFSIVIFYVSTYVMCL